MNDLKNELNWLSRVIGLMGLAHIAPVSIASFTAYDIVYLTMPFSEWDPVARLLHGLWMLMATIIIILNAGMEN